jgi:hypothetical protein
MMIQNIKSRQRLFLLYNGIEVLLLKYQIELLIERDIEDVSPLFIDKKAMLVWEKGLKSIESHTGELFESGSKGDLIFWIHDQEMHMHVTVESCHLPDEITLVYEVKGTWNRCVNTFIKHPLGTSWIMDVEFKFEEDPKIPKERFMEQTKMGMTYFKDYVEARTKD